jgi:hypothetical protein
MISPRFTARLIWGAAIASLGGIAWIAVDVYGGKLIEKGGPIISLVIAMACAFPANNLWTVSGTINSPRGAGEGQRGVIEASVNSVRRAVAAVLGAAIALAMLAFFATMPVDGSRLSLSLMTLWLWLLLVNVIIVVPAFLALNQRVQSVRSYVSDLEHRLSERDELIDRLSEESIKKERLSPYFKGYSTEWPEGQSQG